MMILQLLSEDESQIHEIADYLLGEELLANVMISNAIIFRTRSSNGTIQESKQYRLQGISKSLLFQEINKRLKKKYGVRMPLLYSEPIILIDPVHQDAIIEALTKV